MNFTIRKKLLLVSLAVLAIPWMGLEYVREIERYLRDSLETSLTDFARAMAVPLQEQPELFPLQTDSGESVIYVHTIEHPVLLDGYLEDWQSYIDWSSSWSEKGLSYRLLMSRHEQYFYLLLQVNDHKIVYQHPEQPDAINNDHVELVFTDSSGKLTRLYFSPSAPGTIRPFRINTFYDEYDFEFTNTQYSTNINAEWQVDVDGYNLELAIPRSLVGEYFGLIVHDVDNEDSRQISTSLGTAGDNTAERPGRLVTSSPEIKNIIKGYSHTSGRRVWILDNLGRVLANVGRLENIVSKSSLKSIYALLLPAIERRFKDDLAGASRLQSAEVTMALQGQSGSRWRASPDGKAIVVSAATPIWVDGKVHGAVVVEQTTSGIQIQQRQAMSDLLNKTLIVFFIVTCVLLLFATRLSMRLRQLGKQADESIDEHGRVVQTFKGSKEKDEIGELSRHYAAMLSRLKEYNDYLENMSGRLSHELRTPITVVQSSLDHLQLDDKSQAYLQRAREGIERLQLLVKRLSEAARLEQALQSSYRQSMNINELVSNCVKGYQVAYVDTEFSLSLPNEEIVYGVTPDLFVQMLDKLIANAIDFNLADKPIEIHLDKLQSGWSLSILNYGSQLPEVMDEQLFNSMVSIRENKSDDQPHLGLGLYIVRLIAEFHGATIRAENITAENAVRFILDFPRMA